MKLVTYERNGERRVGVVADDDIIDVQRLLGGDGPAEMIELLQAGDSALKKIKAALKDANACSNAVAGKYGQLDLQAPVPNPPKLMMGGRNYLRHIDELREREDASIKVPPTPRIFSKYNICITGPGKPVIYPRMVEKLDFEGEFSVVIGTPGRFISEDKAMDHVAGYTIVNDVTARDIQLTGELIVSKNFVTFGPMGPWLITSDEVDDPHNLSVRTFINGDLVSESHTSDMLFNIPQYISFLSKVFPLEVGDVLTTGSPPGPGMFRDPPLFLKVGDVMRIDVENVGSLENRVEEEV